MIRYQDFSSAEFARTIGDELAAYFAAFGTRFQRLFYFEGQDPFSNQLPSEAISALYWGLSGAARNRMTEGLVDVLGTRLELLPPAALIEVVTTIGLIHRVDALAPMVRIIGQRSDAADVLRPTYASAIMVLKGFAPERLALDAGRTLVGFAAFPDDLVYDVLEVLIRDPAKQWSDYVLELQARMESDYEPSAYPRIKARLTFTAQEIAARVSIGDIAIGLSALVGPNVESLLYQHLGPRRDPIGILVTELVLDSDAPFELVGHNTGYVILRGRNSRATYRISEHLPLYGLATKPSPTDLKPRFSWLQEDPQQVQPAYS